MSSIPVPAIFFGEACFRKADYSVKFVTFFGKTYLTVAQCNPKDRRGITPLAFKGQVKGSRLTH